MTTKQGVTNIDTRQELAELVSHLAVGAGADVGAGAGAGADVGAGA